MSRQPGKTQYGPHTPSTHAERYNNDVSVFAAPSTCPSHVCQKSCLAKTKLKYLISSLFGIAGESCHAAEPGFFRICYAVVDHDTILQLVKRLKDFVSKTDSERQAMPLWISRGALEQTKKDIQHGLAEPEATALQ